MTSRCRSAWLQGLVAGSLVLATLASAAPARAQSVTLSQTIRRDQDLRDQGNKRYWINRADCLADDVFTFASAQLLQATSYQLEVWAGPASSDCSALESRNTTSGPCWQVGTANTQVTPVDIQVRARDVVGHNFAGDGNWGVGSGTEDDCNSESGGVSGSGLTLWFLLLDSGASVGTPTKWPADSTTTTGYTFGYDLVGPGAPTKVSAGIGEGLLVVSWSITASDDLRSFKLFCDPKSANAPSSTPAAAGAGGGTLDASIDAANDATSSGGASVTDSGTSDATGAGGSGGSGGGGGGNPECPSAALIPGEAPPLDYECGNAGGNTASEGNAKGLVNGTNYAVGVSAVDDVGNPGPLSQIACGSPEPVDDFFEVYRRAGGKGGGGFCALGADPSPGALLLLAGALGAFLLRRRRPSC